MRLVLAASACALAVLAAGSASAQEHRIAYGDLDLSSREGAAQFDRRLNRVAREACGAGSPLDQARCVMAFRAEVRALLPDARRVEYARGRMGREQARAVVRGG